MLCAHPHAQCRKISGNFSKLDPSCHGTSVLLGRETMREMRYTMIQRMKIPREKKETKVRFIYYVHGLEYLETVMPRENVI